jgi:hypothetical protein
MAAKGLRLATLEGSVLSCVFSEGWILANPAAKTELAITLRGGASDADPHAEGMLAVATCCGKTTTVFFCCLAQIREERSNRFWIILDA